METKFCLEFKHFHNEYLPTLVQKRTKTTKFLVSNKMQAPEIFLSHGHLMSLLSFLLLKILRGPPLRTLFLSQIVLSDGH